MVYKPARWHLMVTFTENIIRSVRHSICESILTNERKPTKECLSYMPSYLFMINKRIVVQKPHTEKALCTNQRVLITFCTLDMYTTFKGILQLSLRNFYTILFENINTNKQLKIKRSALVHYLIIPHIYTPLMKISNIWDKAVVHRHTHYVQYNTAL